MRRRKLLVVAVLAWAATRAVLAWAALHDDEGLYQGRAPAAHDMVLYDFWAQQFEAHRRPYADFDLEYPPANLPFMVGPRLTATASGTTYEPNFVAMALGIDALALAGLVVLAAPMRRWWAPGAWLVAIPLLGPVSLSRLDLVPAAALIWAVVLARSHRWIGAGLAMGIATGTKVFAGLLVPIWVFLAGTTRARVRFLGGGAVALALPLLFFIDVPADLVHDVWGFHSGRGIAFESSWGSLLVLGDHLAGERSTIRLQSGSWEIIDPSADLLKDAATLAVGAVALHAAYTARRVRAPDLVRLTTLSASTVVLAVALGNILSPQYVIWCAGATAAAAAVGARVGVALGLVVVAAALSHLVFPIYFFDVVEDRGLTPVLLLVARNGALVGAGVLLLRRALEHTRAPSDPSASVPGTEEQERVPVAT